MGWNSVPNVHLIDQLTEATYDGKPLDNGPEDCVFCSSASGVRALDPRLVVSGDELKDAAKGANYQGGGNAAWLVPILARAPYNVNLQAIGGSQAQLIGILRAQIKAGHPCLITIPSNWNTAPANPLRPGNSHCVLACGIDDSDSGNMTAMNPWHGFWQTMPIAWWRARLCYGQVWPLSKIGAPVPPFIPAGWADNGTTLTGGNGVPFVNGFRAYVLAKLQAGAWRGGNAYLSEWGDANMTVQPCAASLLLWTPTTGVYEGGLNDALALVAHIKQGKVY